MNRIVKKDNALVHIHIEIFLQSTYSDFIHTAVGFIA